jgi:hypothetical protein
MMGKDLKEIMASINNATLSVEAAGAGFAASVAMAERYIGMEISSMAALSDAGITISAGKAEVKPLSAEMLAQIQALTLRVYTTLSEQSADWKRRSIFEQQWLVRSFKQNAGRPVEQWLSLLKNLETCAGQGNRAGVQELNVPLNPLARYYTQLGEAAKGYVKDPVQLEEQLRIVTAWRDECLQLNELLN